MKKETQGFTLIELLIVIAIIGILAAVLVPNLLGSRKRAYDTAAMTCAKSIQTAQATWQIDNRTYAAINATSGIHKGYEGVSKQCGDANMSVAETATPSVSTYSVEVADVRGSKTYTVGPEALTSVAGVPTSATAMP